MTHTTEISALLAGLPIRNVLRPTDVTLNENTYSPGNSGGQSWLPFVFDAFSWVGARNSVNRALLLGTGNGVDALGAVEAFPLDEVCVTDLSPDVVAISLENIRRNLNPCCSAKCSGFVSNLYESVPKIPYCLIVENLPNLPAKELDVRVGINSASFHDAKASCVPTGIAERLLTLHYLALAGARAMLRDGGGILTTIGGRVELEEIFSMHKSLDYTPTLAAFGFKVQTEAAQVVPGYANECRHGLDFIFYRYDALKKWESMATSELSPLKQYEVAKEALAQYEICAADAADLTAKGQRVVHSVYVVYGKREKVTLLN